MARYAEVMQMARPFQMVVCRQARAQNKGLNRDSRLQTFPLR